MMPCVDIPRVAKALRPRLTVVNDAIDRRSKAECVPQVKA